MHAADIMGRTNLALIGPTAFGFPMRENSKILDVPLSCRPCTKDGRGRCHNPNHKACLTQIVPARVSQELQKVANRSSHVVI
jgi:heptosyltransferase-2